MDGNSSVGGLSRSSSFRRRTASFPAADEDGAGLLEGDESFAQLQVGDRVMLANKELSTSTHLRRRMPRGAPRKASKNGDGQDDIPDAVSADELAARLSALSSE
jgi:hypothetical protein